MVEPLYRPSYPDPEVGEQDPFESNIEVAVSLEDDKDLDYKPKRHTRKRSRNINARSQAHSYGPPQERKRTRINSNTGGLLPTRLNATIPSTRNPKILCTECKTPFPTRPLTRSI
ncbi:C2H2 finger domain-containing protein [Colletotrichum tofieldiae]|nr:C2H2 finger domain-containing protein [Colletotrichum tofieldiae]